MVIITNTFNLPFLILVWLIEGYFFLAVVRLILAHIPNASQSHFYQQVKLITDFVPDLVGRQLRKFGNKVLPSWLPWVVTVLLLCLARQILIRILMT
jgi:hypothetical protein